MGDGKIDLIASGIMRGLSVPLGHRDDSGVECRWHLQGWTLAHERHEEVKQ
jgi:hypothetical protein